MLFRKDKITLTEDDKPLFFPGKRIGGPERVREGLLKHGDLELLKNRGTKAQIQSILNKLSHNNESAYSISERLYEISRALPVWHRDTFNSEQEYGTYGSGIILCYLDYYEIYGQDIQILYQNCCRENYATMFLSIETIRCGYGPHLKKAIDAKEFLEEGSYRKLLYDHYKTVDKLGSHIARVQNVSERLNKGDRGNLDALLYTEKQQSLVQRILSRNGNGGLNL